jgi:hypothetical protein
MPTDIAEDIYRYLARDWGLLTDTLTESKCRQLTREIPALRKDYYRDRKIAYHLPNVRRAYLAAFAPRYAYILYKCLNRVKRQALPVVQPWHKQEGVICLVGGGPACEVFGLVDWLDENGINPRYLRAIIVDREGYWRTFHSFLFAELINKHFRKTLVIPSYESVDFPVPKGERFDRTTVNYNFAQTGLLAEARIISVINCLSEVSNHRGIECHLRFLTRLAWNQQLVICADSAAKKRRPRMKWLKDSFDLAPHFRSTELYSNTLYMRCPCLRRGVTSRRISPNTGAPRWETDINRWV